MLFVVLISPRDEGKNTNDKNIYHIGSYSSSDEMKGISSVVSIVMILMITIVLIGFAFVWFSKMFAATTEPAMNQSETTRGMMSKMIKIENVYRNGNTNFSVTIRNIGTQNIAESELGVYKNGEPVTCTFTNGISYGSVSTCSSTVSCSLGDMIRVTSPSNPDALTC